MPKNLLVWQLFHLSPWKNNVLLIAQRLEFQESRQMGTFPSENHPWGFTYLKPFLLVSDNFHPCRWDLVVIKGLEGFSFSIKYCIIWIVSPGSRWQSCPLDISDIATTLCRIRCKHTSITTPCRCVSDSVNCFTGVLSRCSKHSKLSHIFLVSVQGTVDLWSYMLPIDRYSHTL